MRSASHRPPALAEAVRQLVPWCMAGVLAAAAVLPGCRRAEVPRATTPAAAPTAADAAQLPDIAGTYALSSINGTALPFTVTHEGPGIRVTSGTFTIRPDGTCTSVMAFVMPSGEPQSREVGATYSRKGSVLTMQWQGAGVTNGTVEGDTFTMENEGQVFLYRKTD